MAAAMPRLKIKLTLTYFPTDEYIGRLSKGCVDFVFSGIAQLLHLVEPTATDNPDRRNFVVGLSHAEI